MDPEQRAPDEGKSPNEKLSIAGIGVGDQGAWNIGNCEGENVVALRDVDERWTGATFHKFPKARQYRDFRKMLDEMGPQIDAVVVATPDHTHAPAAVRAMRMGKHCYCENPLAHSVAEVRTMIEVAAKNKLATQMGTQIHAGFQLPSRRELVQGGAIGPVIGSPRLASGNVRWHLRRTDGQRPRFPTASIGTCGWAGGRATLSLGYCPVVWRDWWDFGSGGLGDFGCHDMDLPFWAS